MSLSLFDSASFSTTLLFVEKIFNKEKYIRALVSECKNDPTLTLNLQIILEAKQLELQLTTKEKYWDPNMSSANTILKTAIAAAIRHGILNVIKESGKLPLIPTNITNHQFTRRGIINYLRHYPSKIEEYLPKFVSFDWKPHPYPTKSRFARRRCSKCKKMGHIRQNCPIIKKAKEDSQWEGPNPWSPWIKAWAGNVAIPNEDWNTPPSSPSSTTAKSRSNASFSPLSSISSLLFNVSDIED